MRTVVLPTYNERETMPLAIEGILRVSQEHDLGLDVLVVDDDSPDGTGVLADGLAAKDARIRVLHRAGKEGLAKAYFAGFREALAAGAELVFEMDADLSHDPAYLPGMVDLIAQGADLVLGSRYVKGGGVVDWPLSRRLISRGGSLYSRLILGLPYHDLTGGFKCFRRRVLEALDFDAIGASGYGFQIETTYRVHQLGFRIEELPIVFADRTIGESKMSKGILFEAMLMVWKLRFSPPAHA